MYKKGEEWKVIKKTGDEMEILNMIGGRRS